MPAVSDFLLLQVDGKKKLLRSKWLRPVSSEELKEGIGVVGQCIVSEDSAYWLSDARLLNTITFVDQQWVVREIAPLIANTNLQKFARIVTADVFNYISFENMVQRIKEEHSVIAELGQFTSEGAATDWLLLHE
ncbi:hypothetical protein CLV24_11687 [Pontibacter ummariensis]|uniref:SpoIIAA-like n=1 Tax=Pontibacter ummariensis TaxID=1610492 RepID=A0A239I5N5_9BACT|nr:hypothetical protein [Pontibacter ummariensis]PRY10019.1 hypothetical protein CLV24_11687 [Pontibacter ummariensis]SNS89186.1 hypothetical protein SAMN06296052_11612 [Pontibacter ummariensis]